MAKVFEKESTGRFCSGDINSVTATPVGDNVQSPLKRPHVVTAVCLRPDPGPDGNVIRILPVFDCWLFQAINPLRLGR